MLRLTALALGVAAAVLAAPPVPFHFVPNAGQLSPGVRYVAPVRNAAVLLTESGVTVEGPSRITLEFEGRNRATRWTATATAPGTTTYTIGNDPAKWFRDLPHYSRIERRNLYPGIDVVAYGAEGRFEYDFVLAPTADPSRIRLRFDPSAQLRLLPNGDLEARAGRGEFLQRLPTIYQTSGEGDRRRVDGRYRLLPGNRVAFDVGSYDPTRALTIDPVLESATLLGGAGSERLALADPTAYVVGSTVSADFPGVPVGPHSRADIFLYNPVTQSTFIVGGSGDDIVTCASGAGGYLAIGGHTDSRDLPVRSNLYPRYSPQTLFGGGERDGFLILAWSGGVSLLTYFGGSGDDRVLAVHSSGSFSDDLVFGGSTTSTDLPVAQPWQRALSGGIDGFAAVYNSSASTFPLVTYAGGPEDDRVLAVAAVSATEIYVAGETRSPEGTLPAPRWTGLRRGASDGFLLHASRATPYSHPFVLTSGAYWGGSDEDRVTQMQPMPDGRVAVAGQTASPDFAAGETALPGLQGPNDAFLAVATPGLASVSWARLFGGSGADEPLALAAGAFNDLLLGGATTSADFPLRDAIQSKFAGGASDGFLLHVDSTGKTIWSSYYGGAGEDRVTSVRFEKGPRVFFGGTTDSTDLPLNQPRQPENAGGGDLFYGSLIVPVIRAQEITGGKDLAAPGYALLGDRATAIGAPLTITSSDPARLLVASRVDELGQASVTVSVRSASDELAGRSFFAYCLVDSGTHRLTLSAPGYPDRVVPVRCVPSALVVSKAEIVVPSNGNGVGGGSFSVNTAALDPATGREIGRQSPRGGIGAVRFDAAATDSGIVSLTNSSGVVDPAAVPNASTIYFATSAIGATDIVLTAAGPFAFSPSDRVRVRVTGPAISLYIPAMARDFVSRIGIMLSPRPPEPIDLTLATSDDSKARITSSPVSAGTATYGMSCGESCAAYLEALDGDGPVSITVSGAGLDPVTVLVPLVEPIARLYDSRYNQPLLDQVSYGPGGFTASVVLSASVPSPGFPDTTTLLRQGAAPLEIRLTSSNPEAASVADQPFRIGPGGRPVASFFVSTKANGQSVLSAAVSGVPAHPLPVIVVVRGNTVALSPGTVGANLQIPAPISIPYSDDARTITITSADPSRLVISDDATALGTGALAFNTRSGRQIYLQAIGGTGDVELTAAGPNVGEAKTTIRIVPSGVAWTTESLSVTALETPGKDQTPGASLAAYALDPENLAPLAMQAARPGLDPLTLESSNPAVAAPVSASVSLNLTWRDYAAAVPVEVALKSPGESQFAIRQPPGFVTPAGRRPLRVRVGKPTFRLTELKIGRFFQSQVSAIFPQRPPSGDPLPPMTVTSSDPGRLLLSATAPDAGAASAIVRPPFDGFPPGGSPYQPFYIQAIGEPADVQVTASAPGFEDATTAVQIVPTSLVLSVTSGTPVENQTVRTDMQANPIRVSVYPLPQDGRGIYVSGSETTTLWPGFPATTIPIGVSNPSVATVESNPTLNARTNSAAFFVRPLAPGETEVSLTPPPGFAPVASGLGQKLKVVVAGPAIALPDITLGRDLVAGATFAVLNGPAIPPADVEVTVTSSDPSKVLLSDGAAQPGAASVTLRIPGNRSIATAVYIHALDDTGRVTLQVSAPGYTPRTSTITLAPMQFTADPSYSLTVQLQQPQTVALRVGPLASPQQNHVAQLRPGVLPFTIAAKSRNPEILTVSPERITAAPGTSRLEFKLEGVAAGETIVALTVPPPYSGPAEISVTVRGGSLFLNGARTLGKDLQSVFNLTHAPVTVASSDPSRVLVSTTPGGAGQASAAVTEGRVYVHALTDSGTATLTASGPGYQPVSVEIACAPPVVVFGSSGQSPALSTLSPPLTLNAILTTKDEIGTLSLRPGAAPVVVPIALSDPAVGSVSPSQLTFSPGNSTASFTFTPRASGSELISLGIPPGFGDPLARRHLLLTVTAARFALTGSLAVGKDLQAQVSASLPGVTGQTVSVELGSADPARLVLGLKRDSLSPSATLSFTSATQSIPVYLAGLASSGFVTLTATAGALPPATYTVTLQPSGFRFGSTSTTVNAGSSTSLQIHSSMLSPSLSPAGDFALRADLPAPVPLTVTSSNPNVVAAPAGPIYFNPGDSQQRFTISGKSPGVATLTLTPPEGWSIPAGANRITVIVQ